MYISQVLEGGIQFYSNFISLSMHNHQQSVNK